MKVSFDGLRKNLARSYNQLFEVIQMPHDEQIEELQKEELIDAMLSLRQDIGILLLMYDDENKDDMNCLIDEVELLNFEHEEDE